MAQLVALPKIDALQGINLGQCDPKQVHTKQVAVLIESCPAKIYNVFRNEPNLLPELSPNYVASVTPAGGEWGKIGSEKVVVYYPEGKDVSRKTEWFKDKLIRADEIDKSVAWKALEGDLLKNYKSFFAGLVVYKLGEVKVAQWTIKYEKRNPCCPDPDNYLALLEKVTKDVDDTQNKTD